MVFKCWVFHLQTLDKSLRCRKRQGKLEPQLGQEVHYVTESHLVFNLFRQRWHQRCFRFTTDNGTLDFIVFTGVQRRCMLENWTLCPNSSPCYSISFKNISCIRSLGYARVRVLRLRWALVFSAFWVLLVPKRAESKSEGRNPMYPSWSIEVCRSCLARKS